MRQSHLKKTILRILVGIMAGFFLFFLLNYVNIVQLSRVFPFLSFLPTLPLSGSQGTRLISPTPLESCWTKKEEHPLIYDVSQIDNYIVGAYVGNVTHITNNPLNKNVTVELTSLNSVERHQFAIDPTKTKAFDGIHYGLISIQDIKVGQKVKMTFNCQKDTTYAFKIISIGTIQ